jgi:ribokinase
MKNSILVVGSSNYDIILNQDKFAVTGETVLANKMTVCGGGKGANQAVQCAKLGNETIFIGSVGQDSMGDFLIKELNKYGLCADYVKRSEVNSGVGIVNSIPNGEVQATVFTGANFDITPAELRKHGEVFKNAKVLILQLEIPVEVVYEAINLGEENNCYIILNAAPARKLDLEYMKKINCLIVNETEAGFYLGKGVNTFEDVKSNSAELLSLVKDICIVTLGEKGSVLVEKDKCTKFNAEAVNVVETTGAGDSYIGAFATKVFEGGTLEEACNFATKVSSITVQNIGAQSSMPTKIDIDRECENGTRSEKRGNFR